MRIVQVAAIDMTHVKLLNTLNKKSLEHGIEVHCVSSGGDYVQEIKDEGFHFHEIEINREINPIKNIKSIISMVKVFKILKPDIVHVHTPVAAVLGRIAAKIAKVPTVIYTAHGFYFHEGMSDKQYKIFFNIEKWIGRFFTDYIFTQSKEDFDVAVNNKFLSSKKRNHYYHISNGIDLDHQFNIDNISKTNVNNIEKELNIKENDVVVSFIGRLVEEKGILDLLESYSKIKYPNVKFIIMGDLPKSERDLTAINLINKFKENPNIIFTGQIKNINEYLYVSDIFCLPSYREGMPRSIIEAMAMKNAVIATNIRGSREEVVEDETGYLVNLKSSSEIAERIDVLASNPNKLSSMKEKGLQRAKALYDENNVAEMQIDIFKKVKEGE
ncbi:glycosyltransferase family 4 protein [Staphylococcus simulans]|uniref:glycosyltransferase family 4 protein n=1 Tax=Staphylococcus simulans TaxID=1286 RepID=UPI001E2F1DAD|nr:glycosyltransferase family 4 protein [Staphylococcus simulans]MCD8914592.1 glycosyltransferase family 4 protein [Staphylococcus simulans]